MTKRITQADIAKVAGVTVTSVSMALKNHPRISAETRNKIQRLAEEMGYRPDPTLSRLMQHLKSGKEHAFQESLAWVTNYAPAYEGREIFLTQLHDGAMKRADTLGYKLESFSTESTHFSPERLSEILNNRGINGVIIAPLRNVEDFASFHYKQFATVTIGPALHNPRINRVCPSLYFNMKMLLQKIEALGSKRMGFCPTAILDKRVDHLWLAAFLTHQHHAKAPAPIPPLIVEGLPKATFLTWLKQHQPDALITDDEEIWKWVEALRKKQGLNLKIFSPSLTERAIHQGISGIDEAPHLMGSAAVDLLTAHLIRHEKGIPADPKEILIQGSITLV